MWLVSLLDPPRLLGLPISRNTIRCISLVIWRFGVLGPLAIRGTLTCYYVNDLETNEHAIFTGDTLFTGGCGRFFEGVGEEMDKALNFTMLDGVGRENLAVTKVFPGHEYTKGNVKFIRKAVYKQPGENKAVDELEEFANKNRVTTGCFTLQDELNFNPFMRLEDPVVRKAVGDVKGEWTRARVMDKLRE